MMQTYRTPRYLLGCLFLGLVVSITHAQNAAPIHPVDGEYIKEWLVLGPFFPNDLEKDFLADVGGERDIDPREGDTVTAADGTTLTWKRYTNQRNFVDLPDAVGDHEYATAYVYCRLQSQMAGGGAISVSGHDGAVIWINGQRVYHNPRDFGYDFDETSGVNFRAGTNLCLVKVYRDTGLWHFSMRVFPPVHAAISGRITDENGEPIPNTVIRLEQDGEEITQGQADVEGRYHLPIYPAYGSYDLSATAGERGDWQLGIPLSKGARRTLNFILKKAISIEGTLMMLDDTTPHVGVVVQAVIPPTPATRRGEDKETPLSPRSDRGERGRG